MVAVPGTRAICEVISTVELFTATLAPAVIENGEETVAIAVEAALTVTEPPTLTVLALEPTTIAWLLGARLAAAAIENGLLPMTTA